MHTPSPCCTHHHLARHHKHIHITHEFMSIHVSFWHHPHNYIVYKSPSHSLWWCGQQLLRAEKPFALNHKSQAGRATHTHTHTHTHPVDLPFLSLGVLCSESVSEGGSEISPDGRSRGRGVGAGGYLRQLLGGRHLTAHSDTQTHTHTTHTHTVTHTHAQI